MQVLLPIGHLHGYTVKINTYVLLCVRPARLASHPLECVRVADQFVQHVDDLAELGPLAALSLPALQHELVQCYRTLHRCW